MNPTRALSVLVVDDDADSREALLDVLSDDGLVGVEACNGLDALERLRRGLRPDVIVLDLAMPIMSGSRFLAERRGIPLLARIPVIAVTASRDTREALDLGANEALGKPFSPPQICAAVRRVALRG